MMTMKTKKNITNTNTQITALADIIQKSRIALFNDNKKIYLRTDDTRRIILICLMLFRTRKDALVNDSISLNDALSLLAIMDDHVFGFCDDDKFQMVELSGALTELAQINQHPDWCDLINYALEALEYDVETYFNVKVSRGTRGSNKKKKASGIYYTPIDVVNFIVSQNIAPVLAYVDKPSILDCSCGTGVFLIQSLIHLETVYNPKRDLNTSIDTLDRCIWGIDISQAATDCCKAIFLQFYLDNYKDAATRLNEIGDILNKSILVGDATQLQDILSKNPFFPPLFDCIVGNPPYVTKGKETNLFIPFVDNMMCYSSNYSCSALILPLSICYSQGGEFVNLRKRIQNDDASWTFMNYDRSPDSLFGDQVKTRNTILFRSNIEPTTDIFTTTLKRWTSTDRSSLFTNYMLCEISGMSLSEYVPKISTVVEKAGYECISSGSSNLSALLGRDDSGYPLIINGTAYNWLCAYDHLPPSIDENGKPYTSGTTRIYYLPDSECRDFCIAVLSNRIAYWYWVVVGDGFHFNNSFLSEFKVGKDTFTESQYTELCRLGKAYSDQIKRYPTTSYNAGKKIVNYSHWEAMEVVRSIEKIIVDALNLSIDFAFYIEQWYFKQVHCNRDNEKR